MKEDVVDYQRMNILIEKIFLLNHNIVSQMISQQKSTNIRFNPMLIEKIEDIEFEKLSRYYDELRIFFKETIDSINEANHSMSEKRYAEIITEEDIITESVDEKNIKDSIVYMVKEKLEKLYVSMNFIPVSVIRDEQNVENIESIYVGTPEEVFTKIEYQYVMDSIDKQMIIISLEEYFEEYGDDKNFKISILILSSFIDELANLKKYALAERQCQKFVERASEDKDLNEYPELKEVIQKVEFLSLLQRYKRKFEVAVGSLNNKVKYSQSFLDIWENGEIGRYTQLSEEDINLKLKVQIERYSNTIKQSIRVIFRQSLEKYKNFRRERDFRKFTSSVKEKIVGMGDNVRKRFRKNNEKKPESSGEKIDETLENSSNYNFNSDGR